MLTEIPGWPDAPKKIRFRRALPILIPCALSLLLLAWNKGVRDPHRRHERESHQALLDQDREIEILRLGFSEQQAGELSARMTRAEREILKDSTELIPVLEGMKQKAKERQWEGGFQPYDLSATDAPATPDEALLFLSARAKISPASENREPFSSLLALLDVFSAAEKRIDLTRLGIRADEQGRYTAELNFRLATRSPHEKTPQ